MADADTFNKFLADHSYADGFVATKLDLERFASFTDAPDAKKFPNLARWFNHVKSFQGDERAKYFAAEAGKAAATSAAPAAKKDDDEFDLFGEEDDEAVTAREAEIERIAQERAAAKAASGKVVIAKSMVTLDVKPWDDETNLKEMEEKVRAIAMDGLVWGSGELVAIGYGIKKLRITAVVEDLKVSVDDLQEQIGAFEDHVQSVDVHTFNKL